MQIRILSIFALLFTAVLAQQSSGDNAFKIPPGGFSLVAGQPATIEWTPSTPGTVTLKLRSGANSALDSGTIIKGWLLLLIGTMSLLFRLAFNTPLSLRVSHLLFFMQQALLHINIQIVLDFSTTTLTDYTSFAQLASLMMARLLSRSTRTPCATLITPSK